MFDPIHLESPNSLGHDTTGENNHINWLAQRVQIPYIPAWWFCGFSTFCKFRLHHPWFREIISENCKNRHTRAGEYQTRTEMRRFQTSSRKASSDHCNVILKSLRLIKHWLFKHVFFCLNSICLGKCQLEKVD